MIHAEKELSRIPQTVMDTYKSFVQFVVDDHNILILMHANPDQESDIIPFLF